MTIELKVNSKVHGFTVSSIKAVSEVASDAYVMVHGATGARLLYLANDDDNKCFAVSFCTPPQDDCGTPHILEHSVLCGSDKYPLKEPFLELVKSSLNTFLNAMTYPDKTMYPVASKNEADLANLTDVYLDAVFHPLITSNPQTLMQEGWHYHLEGEDEPVTINGVVYNEMKGAYSNPDDVMENMLFRALYPDTPYAKDSGGDPDKIPELTYERFIEYYRSHYSPSNAYFYLYGDMDPEPFLEKINASIEGFEKTVPVPAPGKVRAFDGPVRASGIYSASEGSEDTASRFEMAWRIGQATDSFLSYSMNVLNGILMDRDASPLRKALLDSGLADEYSSDLVSPMAEPFYTISARNAAPGDFDAFVKVVRDTLRDLSENGIDEELITASLNSYEFDLREADSGHYPKGLLYLQDIMESWLYGGEPTAHLEYETYLARLRENANSRFYQDMIKTWLLDNPNAALLSIDAQVGLAASRAQELAEKLAAFKESADPAELEGILTQTAALKARQAAEDPEEIRDKVPVLDLSEIPATIPKPNFSSEECSGATVYTHEDRCRGIVYADFLFPFIPETAQDISTAELLSRVLASYETENYSELELAKQLGIYLGDAEAQLVVYSNAKDPQGYSSRFGFYSRALSRNMEKLFTLSEEICRRTRIADPARLATTVAEEIAKFEQRLMTGAHGFVSGRLSSYHTRRGAFNGHVSGLEWYAFLKETRSQLASGDTGILDKMGELLKRIVSRTPDVLITAEEGDMDQARERARGFLALFPNTGEAVTEFVPEPLGQRKEAFVTPASVNYVGRGANFILAGIDYDPIMLVARGFLASGYLWDNVRLIGGAYGAFLTSDKTGTLNFLSYRDPHVAQTLSVFENAGSAFEDLALRETDLNKIIIGTIADLDAPRPVYSVGRMLLTCIYQNDSWEEQQENRAKILKARSEDIQRTGLLFAKALGEFYSVCVAGSATGIAKDSALFDTVLEMNKDF